MTSDIGRLIERDQVALLLAVVETGSFSAAAASLGITPSSISQQVKRLEALAGCPLFHRGRRGAELTSAGEVVIRYARAMLSLTDDLRQHLTDVADTATVRIGLADDFCRTALPTLLGLLALEFPRVDVRVISGGYDLLAQAVEARTVDLAVMRRWHRYEHTSLVWADEQVWYGHAKFSTGVADPVPLVVPLPPNPTRDTIIEALQACNRPWRIRFESVGLAGIEAALQAGFGLCAGPRRMPLHGVTAMGPGSGLPRLPDVEFILVGPGRSASGAVLAVAELLRQTVASGLPMAA